MRSPPHPDPEAVQDSLDAIGFEIAGQRVEEFLARQSGPEKESGLATDLAAAERLIEQAQRLTPLLRGLLAALQSRPGFPGAAQKASPAPSLRRPPRPDSSGG